MADPSGNPTSDIERSLLNQSALFSFFQARRLMERMMRTRGLPPDRLRVRPALSLEYPRSDVEKINLHAEAETVEIVTTFLGLYGVSSPLPVFYTEDLLAADLDDRHAARALLDAIHQHLYDTFFLGLKKYRPLYLSVEDGNRSYIDILFSLFGLRDSAIAMRIPNPYRLFRYIGLFSQRPRSALGLKTILEDVFPGIPVEVIQCVPQKVKIPGQQRMSLGIGAGRLGTDAVLGSEILDISGKISISIGPLTRTQFQAILDDASTWMTLIFLIKYYLTAPMECDLDLLLVADEAETVQIGTKGWATLGKNTWLFNQKTVEPVRAHLNVNQIHREIKTALSGTGLFKHVPDDSMNRLVQSLTRRELAPGEYLIREGEEGHEAYIIESGSFRIFLGENYDKPLAALKRGNIVGEIALIKDIKRTANVVAESGGVVIVIPKADFLSIFKEQTSLSSSVLDIIKKRMVVG